jgi:hypothetical protein
LKPSPSFRSVRAISITITCASSLLLSACYTVKQPPGATVQTVSTGKLEKKNPIDVVLAPIENASSNENAPLEELRDAFQRELVKRRYSPLSRESVDKALVDAAYKNGSLQEEAVLRVKIERWDSSLWESHTALLVKAEVHMLDARDSSDGDLWTGKIDHRYEFGAYREKFGSDEALLEFACRQIADEILAALPARTTAPGTTSPGH